MKNILKLLLLVALLVYLVFAFTSISGGDDSTACQEVKAEIIDSTHAGFITETEIIRLLQKEGLYPVGRPMNKVDGAKIEAALLKNSFIKQAICYKTPKGRVSIIVSQRLPIMRVKADNGEDYYVDNKGEPMNSQDNKADLVVATGNIDKAFVKNRLICLGRYLHANPTANDLIVQINVNGKRHVDLVPRIGCEVIHLGALADSLTIAKQFRNMRAFYNKVLPKVGWNAYKEISLEFSNQVIAKK